MNATAVRILTQDAVKALEVARGVRTARDEPWVNDVMIFKLDEDREYTMYDFKHLASEPFDKAPWMYMAWRVPESVDASGWKEKINDAFAQIAEATTPA